MRRGRIAIILSVDEEPWTEIEQLGKQVTWATAPQEVLNEVMGLLRAKEMDRHIVKEGDDVEP